MPQFFATPRQALPCSEADRIHLLSGIPVGRHELSEEALHGVGTDFIVARRYFDRRGGLWVVRTALGWRSASGRELWVLGQIWRKRLSKEDLAELRRREKAHEEMMSAMDNSLKVPEEARQNFLKSIGYQEPLAKPEPRRARRSR